MEKHSDIFVCADCYLQHEIGEADDADPSWSVEQYEDGLLAYAGLQIVSGDAEQEREFSWAECDLCGSRLGGSRSHLVVLTSEKESNDAQV